MAVVQQLSVSVSCPALSNIVGTINVEAEEGLARIATITGTPATSSVNLPSLIGQDVTITYRGERIFTGKVDMPTYDQATGLLTLECSDRLQKYFDTLSRFDIIERLETAIPYNTVLWHPAIFNEASTNWEFVQDAMSSVPYSLDLDPYGQVRITPWKAASSPDAVFNGADVTQLSVELTRGNDIINTMDLTMVFRYERIFQRRQVYQWSFLSPGALSWADVAINGIPVTTTDAVMSAITGSDWRLTDPPVLIHPNSEETYTTYLDGEPGIFYLVPGLLLFPTPTDYCIAASFTLEKRWTQQITEAKTIRLVSPTSQTAHGSKINTLSFAIEPDYTSWWFYSVYDKEVDSHAAPQVGGMVSAQDASFALPITPYKKYRYPFDSSSTQSTPVTYYVDSDTAEITNEITSGTVYYDVPYTVSAFISGTMPGALRVETSYVTFNQPIFPDNVSRRYSMTFTVPRPPDASSDFTHARITITGDVITGSMLTLGSTPPPIYRKMAEGQDPPTFRQYYTDAVKVATNVAKTKILASHRRNLVTFTVPMHPSLDRQQTVEVDTRASTHGIHAKGKVFKVTHTIDITAGSAFSTVQLALTLPYAGSDSASDTTPYGKTPLPPSVEYRYPFSVFGNLKTYVGMLPNRTPLYPVLKKDAAGNVTQLPPTVDPNTKEVKQVFGFITDAEAPSISGTPGDLLGYGESRFAINTPPIEASNLYEKVTAEQGIITVSLDNDTLSISPPTYIS